MKSMVFNPNTLDTTFGINLRRFLQPLLSGQRQHVLSRDLLPPIFPIPSPLKLLLIIQIFFRSFLPLKLMSSNLYSTTIQILNLSNQCAMVFVRVSGRGLIPPYMAIPSHMTNLVLCHPMTVTLPSFALNASKNDSKGIIPDLLEPNFFLECTLCLFTLFLNLILLTCVSLRITVLDLFPLTV